MSITTTTQTMAATYTIQQHTNQADPVEEIFSKALSLVKKIDALAERRFVYAGHEYPRWPYLQLSQT